MRLTVLPLPTLRPNLATITRSMQLCSRSLDICNIHPGILLNDRRVDDWHPLAFCLYVNALDEDVCSNSTCYSCNSDSSLLGLCDSVVITSLSLTLKPVVPCWGSAVPVASLFSRITLVWDTRDLNNTCANYASFATPQPWRSKPNQKFYRRYSSLRDTFTYLRSGWWRGYLWRLDAGC